MSALTLALLFTGITTYYLLEIMRLNREIRKRDIYLTAMHARVEKLAEKISKSVQLGMTESQGGLD